MLNSIYEITDGERFSKDWELKNQIRRSALSMMSNIAEGFNRGSDREFIQFLRIATGSYRKVLKIELLFSFAKLKKVI